MLNTLLVVWTGLVVVLMLVSAYWMRPFASEDELNNGFALFLIGAVLLGGSLILWRQLKGESAHEKPHTSKPNFVLIHTGMSFIGIVCLAILTQINLLHPVTDDRSPLFFLRGISIHAQVALFVLGCFFVTWGLIGGRRPRLNFSWQFHHTLLLVIVAVALVLRLWNLEDWIHRFLDELHYGNAVARIESDPSRKLAQPFSNLTAFSWLFPYIQAWTTQLFQPSMIALRIVAVGFGVAQVLAIYLLGTWLIDRKVGLMSALLLATFPIHLHFSRIGIANIADPLWGILAIAFLVRGFQTQRQRDFVLAGLCLGLTQYFYEGGRLFYVPFVVCWLAWLTLFVKRDRHFTFPSLRNLFLLGFTFIVVAFPLYYTWFVNEVSFVPRLDEMGRGEGYFEQLFNDQYYTPLQGILNQILEPLKGYVHLTPTSWFYGGTSGFILVGVVPFFLLGLAHALWRILRVNGSLLFWWLMAGVIAVSFIQDPVTTPRHLVIYPVAILLVAVGIRYTVPMLASIRLQHQPRLFVFMGLLTIILSVYQMVHYFGVHQPNYYREQFYPVTDGFFNIIEDSEDALFRVLDLPSNTDVHIVHPTIIWRFDLQAVQAYWRLTEMSISHLFPPALTADYLAGLSPDRPQAFFLRTDDVESLALIEQYFTLSDAIWSPYDIPQEKQMVLYLSEGG